MSICLSCHKDANARFYTVPTVPSHSCLLMETRGDAISFPSGTIELAVCHECGFISNLCQDESLQKYDPTYEETQHYSSYFSKFAQELAEHWIEAFDIRGKHIVEIGCGKGEFLELMCHLGDNRGTGIDPSCRPERIDPRSRDRIELLREYYAPHHGKIAADVILCRHTLEHIGNVNAFLQQLRDSLSDQSETLVLFELPDTRRVLSESAFWDVYFEHCSYFTAGSLARLFRRCGFDVLELDRVYDDQYLIIAAKPTVIPSQRPLSIEDDLKDTLSQVGQWREGIGNVLDNWRKQLAMLKQNGPCIAWGAGSKCVAFCTTLGITDEIEYVVDINPHKCDKYLPGTGHPIVGPSHLVSSPPSSVVVMNPVYANEIRDTLIQWGCDPVIVLCQ